MSVADGLLVLLAEEPKHGYQLATDFAERTAGRWTLNTGQVYTTLDRLARDGFVVDDGTVDPDDARRRRWRLTDTGRERARAWLTGAAETGGARDELVLRVALAAGSSPALALRVVDAQRTALVGQLQEVRRTATGARRRRDRRPARPPRHRRRRRPPRGRAPVARPRRGAAPCRPPRLRGGPAMTTPAPIPTLRLDHVSAIRPSGRGPVPAVHDLTLEVAPGEMVALMGPSGSGKTSVLHLACGLLAPTSGQVAVDGIVRGVDDRAGWTRARREVIGTVHQRLDLLPGLSVLDNVALPLLLGRTSVGRAHDAARTALDRVDLIDLADAAVTELSGGEQQRVAIARATVGDRHLLLADEPTAALDTATAERVVRLLADLARGGAAVLMATHDTRLAGWADRTVFLRDGRIVAPASPLSTPLSDGGLL